MNSHPTTPADAMTAVDLQKFVKLPSWNRTRVAVATVMASALFAATGYAAGADLKRLSLEQLLNVTVTTASRTPESVSQSTAAVQVITNEAIRHSAANTIPEALRLAGNLNVARKNSHDWGISARGFNTELANKMLVLRDGRTLYTPLFSGVFWPIQDYLLADLEQIEVVRGPGGTMWGANAVNGVINIITKHARDTQGALLEAGAGQPLRSSLAARYGGTAGPAVHYRVYGKYFDRDDESTAAGASANDGWHFAQGGFRVDLGESAPDALTLQGDYYQGEEGLVAGGQSEVSGGNLLARWTRRFSATADFSLQFYYDRTHFTQPVGAFALGSAILAPSGSFTDNLDTYDIDYQQRWSPGSRHQLLWGLGYRFMHDAVANAPSLGFFPENQDQELFSAFLQDEITLTDDLGLTIGTKVEHNHYTGLEFVPSVRVGWQIRPAHFLWGAVSRAVRTPSRIDRDLSQPVPPAPVILTGGPGFKSETLLALELGYRGQPRADVAFSISTFYNRYDDVRSLRATPATVIPFFFANDLEGETYGIELGLRYQPSDWWHIRGSYNLLEEKLRVRPGGVDLNNALNETADPEQQFLLGGSVDLPGNFRLDGTLRWVDILRTHQSGVPATVPSHATLDARLGWEPRPGLELSLTGQNLLDPQHPEFGAPGPGRVEIRRAFHGKVSWRF